MLQRTKALWNRLFGRHQRTENRKRLTSKRRKSFLEGLESRELLAAFVPGSIQGQDGWSGGNIAISTSVTQGVDQTGTLSHTGVGALRISNSTQSGNHNGAFSGWVFGPGLSAAAGQPSSGAPANQFTSTFWIKAGSGTADGSNLEIDLGTVPGDDRNTFMALTNRADADGGLQVRMAEPDGVTGDFRPTQIVATGLSRSVWHKIEITAKFFDGPGNDTFEVKLNGTTLINPLTSGTTWGTFEGYRNGISSPYALSNRMYFRSGAAPSAYGAFSDSAAQGFLVDDLGYQAALQSTPNAPLAYYAAAFEAQPTITYADDDWAGTLNGTAIPDGDLTTPGNQAATFGVDAFATVSDALIAVADGGRIVANAGTYSQALDFNKSLTVVGPNVNIPGTGTRSAEATITGNSTISALGAVTLNGLKFQNIATGGNTLNITTANGHVVTNNVFESVVVGGNSGDVAIQTNAFGGGSFTISNNLIAGNGTFLPTDRFSTAAWQRGVYFSGGPAAATISGNTFRNTRTGTNLDDYPNALASVSGNTYIDAGTGIAIGESIPGVLTAITSITGNTFNNANEDISLRNLSGDLSLNLLTTGNVSIGGDVTVVLGGKGSDTIVGTSGNDFLIGDNSTAAATTNDNNSLTGGGGDDILMGSFEAGIDRALYSAALTTASITASNITIPGVGTFPGWLVASGGAEGNDSLVDMEVIDGAEAGRFLLVGNGGFTSIQAAVNAAVAGDTIIIQSGTYVENVTIGVNVTLAPRAGVTIAPAAGDALTITAGSTRVIGTLATGSSATVVQSGATLGGTGTITGPVTANAGAFVDPGFSPGVLNSGNYNQAGTLNVEIVRPATTQVPGVDHDQVNVTGSVTLSGALNLIFTGPAGAIANSTFFTIINNDSNDPVTGTFTGLANGATFSANGQNFVVFYNGGDGNDVVVGTVSAASPTTVYVEDTAWSALFNGAVIADADFTAAGNQPAVLGYDSFTSIQAAVNAVAVGGAVIVNAGTYVEDVNLNKNGLSLRGAGPGLSVVSGPIGGSGTTIFASGSNLDISGFTVTREGNNTTDWNNPGLNSAGLAIQGLATTTVSIHDNLIIGNRTGIDINNSNGHTIRNNRITDNRTGLIFRNQTDNLTVEENEITNNWTVGVLFLDASGGSNSPVQTALGSTFTNNNLSGNWYGQIVDRQTGGSLPAPGTTNLKNFSGNWLGTTTPVITIANSAEPGYAAQIPVAYGGSAVAPGGQPDIAGAASANIDITPMLSAGTDTNVETTLGRGTYGFQGNFSSLTATAAGAQTGSTGRLQEAINRVPVGGTVLAAPGTYIENVTLNKNVSLLSTAGRAATTIQGISGVGALGTVFLTGTTTAVQLGAPGQGFTIIGIDNGNPGIENGAVYINGTHSNTQIRDNEIRANGDHGLVGEFGGAFLNNWTISGNEFSGQTFVGAQPGGIGFGSQFTTPNVPRQLVTLGNGGGPLAGSNVTNLTFTNNLISGTSGGISSVDNLTPQGNSLATIDAASSNISGNTFAGTTTAGGAALRVRRPNTTITGNTFNTTNMGATTSLLFVQNNTTPVQTIIAANLPDRGALIVGGTTVWQSIQVALLASPNSGATVRVLPSASPYAENVNVNNFAGTMSSVTLEAPTGPVTVDPASGNAFTIPSGVTARFTNTFTTLDPTVVLSGGTLGGNGTITGPVTANAGSFIDPGFSPGILNTGNYNQAGTLNVEIVRPAATQVPGVDHDQVNVTGSVTLSGALNLIFSGPAGPIANSTFFTIINNDSNDPVTGTFTGLANGATFSANGQNFVVFYNGGDGNDVVVGTVSAASPTTVYVEDTAWNALFNGAVIADADFTAPGNQPAVLGYDAFKTIQAGVNAVAVGGTVIVNGGTYNEDVVLGGKPNILLQGAGAATTSIVGQLGGNSVTLEVYSGQTVDGFTITRVLGAGENNFGVAFASGATGATLRNSVLTGNRTAIYMNGSGNSATITRNVINDNRTGILFADTTHGTHTITENAITNNRTFGVLVLPTITSWSAGTVISGNNISGNFASQLENNAPVSVNASGNWWGTTTPTFLNSSVNTLIGADPVTWGYPNPVSQPPSPYPYHISGSNANGIDYTPYLNAGTDTAPATAGFQGDYSGVTVHANAAQVGSVERIQEGVNLVTVGGVVNVLNGTYLTATTTVNKDITIDGQSRTGVVVVPAGEDANVDSSFGSSPQQGFLVSANGVTIQDLTIDGQGNPLLTAGKNNFRSGVMTPDNGVDISNLTFDNLDVKNIYRRAVQFTWNGSGNVVRNSSITQNSGALSANGASVAVFGGNSAPAVAALIQNNILVTSVGTAIISNFGGAINVKGNQISGTSVGMNLAALVGGSIIGGPNPGDGNTINLTGLASDDIGMLVTFTGDSPFANGNITVQGNTVTGSGGDTALMIFRTGAFAVDVLGNNFTATGSTNTGAGTGTGVFISDDETFFGESTTDNNATVNIRGNTISGYARGISVQSVENAGPAETLTVTIGGPLVANNNELIGAGAGSIGVEVLDTDGAGGSTAVTIQNNSASINGFAVGIDVNGGSATITSNHIYDNGTGILVRNSGSATVNNNNFEGAANPDNGIDLNLQTSGTIVGGTLTGNTFAGATYIRQEAAQNLTALASSNTYKETNATVETNNFDIENRIYHKIDNAPSGLVTWVANNIYVTPSTSPTATDNDYTRIANAVAAATNGTTINLQGTFNWTEANAAASWANGNDGLPGTTADNYTLTIPANLNNVTFTAASLGAARIQGPGDLAIENLEGVFVFDGGDNQNTTISNLEIFDFDLGIGFFNGPGGSDAFNGTQIINNRIRVPADLNSIVAPVDVNQNIGIHYSFGINQTIQNNFIDFVAGGISNGANFSSSVGMQSNTSGGGVYNGLLIDNNTLTVLNAQSANPETILGIWENGHAHSSNITVSNNDFVNAAPGNNPALNLQRGFRVTSHSSGSSTVTYSNNTVSGANLGFQWIAGSNFTGNQPVVVSGNVLSNVGTGFLLQSNGVANFTNNSISGIATGIGYDLTNGIASISGGAVNGLGTGVKVTSASVTNLTNVDFDDVTDNATDLQILSTAGAVTIGANNQFAGNTFFIDDQSTQSFNLVGNGTTFDESNNFRIEDKMHHRVDTDLAVTVGLVTWVAGNLYVTGAGTDHSIQRGVDAASSGNTVNVEAGTYAENVNVNKSLSLLGPNAAINPNTGIRVAEAIVLPAVTATSIQGSTSGTIFRVGSGSGHVDVTINGFTIDGHNAALTNGRTLNGVEIHTGAGIVNSVGSFDSNPGGYDARMIVQNNIIQNLERYGVLADGVPSTAPMAGTNVSFNKIDNLPSGNNFGGGRGRGIAFEENHYGSATFNVITRVNVGWQDDNYHLPSPGAGTLIDNNFISTYHRGIFHNLQYGTASPATISNNTIVAEALNATTSNFGVWIGSIQGAATVTVTNNSATGTVYGVELWNNPATTPVTVTGGTLTNNQYGVYMTNNDPQFAAGAASSSAISGISIVNPTIAGIFVEDAPIVNVQSSLAIGGGTSVTGGPVGLLASGANAQIGGNTLNNTVFSGQSGNFITLSGGAEDNQEINATAVTFNGLTGAGATLTQNYGIEDKITHAVDDGAQGFIRVQAGNVFVTPNSFINPATTTPSIQRGIDAVAGVNTVNIQAGSYTGSADATAPGKDINLQLGASPAQVFVAGNLVLNSGDTLTVEIDGTNPATDYDNLVVTGNVTLGGATLNLLQSPASAHTPVLGQTFTLINNDTNVDAVSGTFAGLPAGTTVMLNGQPLKVFYTGNDGNDVILTFATPTVTYAEDTLWSAFPVGQFILDADFTAAGNQSAIYGYDAFSTVQGAVNAVANPGTVIVNQGTYTENVSLTKQLTILGAQRNVDARGRVVGAPNPAVESILTPASAAVTTIDFAGGSAATIVNGLAFTGGTALGVIQTTVGPNNNMQVINNHFSGYSQSALFINRSGSDVTIDRNVMDGSSIAGSGQAIFLDGPNTHHGIQITNNNIINNTGRYGLFVDGNHNVSESATRAPLISGNLFNNNLQGMNLGSRSLGTLGVPVLGPYGGTISNNTFSNNAFDGIQGGPQHVLITQNTFTNNARSGIALTSFGNLSVDRGGQNNLITENTFSGSGVEDVFFSATQAPTTIATNVLFNNSLTSSRSVTYGGTETIQASGNWWGSNLNPEFVANKIGGTGANNVDYTPWLNAGTDTSGTPGFQGNFNNLHVDDDSVQVGATGRITEAVGLLTATGTVQIHAGTYVENVTTAGKAVNVSPGAPASQVLLSGNLTLDSNDTLTIDVDGTSAATQYDNFVVTGTVTLGNAGLTVTGTYVPAAADSFTLINNDAADAISGIFAGLPLGSIVNVNGTNKRIFYTGNDGNDVVLMPDVPATVYVEDTTWSALSVGDFILDADFGTTGNQSAIFGYNAFTTVSAGLTAATASGTVIVNGGTYAEAVVSSGTKTIEITGPDAAQSVIINSLATAAGQNIVLEGSSLLTIGDATTTIIAGAISGPGSLIKTGAGQVTLSGANTYSGTTTVNDGTLLIIGTNSGTGAVNVNNSAVLGGSGSIAGVVNLNGTSRLSPGGSPESLATGNLTFVSGTFYDVQIGGTTPVTQYDQAVVTGTVTLANATLNLQQLSGFNVNNSIVQTFTIIDNDGSADAVSGTFNGFAEGASIVYPGGQVFISYAGGDGNDVVLYSTPTVNGTPGADTLVLRQNSPTLIEYSLNGAAFVQVTNTLPFAFNGLGGTDLMLVDTSNGDPIPAGNAFLSGEILNVQRTTGAASDVATYVPSTTGGAGLVTLAGFGDVNFTGASNVDFVNLTTVNVQTATANDTMTFADGNTATNSGTVPAGYSIAAANDLAINGANAVVGLRNVTNTNLSTVTGGGDGNDAITFNTIINANGITNLTIATGVGTDSVTVGGAVTVSGNINISSQSIAVNNTLTGGATSTVTLNAGTGAITTSGAGVDVVAQDLSATATTGIDLDTTVLNITTSNTGAGSINIDETNGANVLSVSAANGSATVTSVTGNLVVTTVSASTSVTLTATAGSITDANAAANNITASSLTATAATGIDLDTTITTLTSANVTGIGAIDINDLAGGLIVTSATTADGAITLNATGGDLTLTNVIAGGTGRNITATTTTSGNILVALVDASGDNLSLTAAAGGAINETAADATADLIAGTATLAGPAGIGNLGTIEVNFTTLTSAATTGAAASIDLSDLAGGLVVTSATTTDGAITLNAIGGDLTLTTVTAGGTARNITATTTTSGTVFAGNVTATSDTITVNSAGAIEELGADAGSDLSAAILLLTSVSGIGAAAQIEVDGNTGAGLGLTASVTGTGPIDIRDVDGLRVNSAITNSGNINLVGANGTLTLTLVTAGGSSVITASTLAGTGTIELGALTALGDSVTLSAFTNITDDNGAALNVSAASLTATAATGIGSGNTIETSIDTLTATNATSNNIEIAETDAITLASVVQSTDNNANDIIVTAGGTITVGVVNAGTTAGDVTLIATVGSIIDDASDTTPDVIGDVVIMTAVSGVGQSAGNGPLDTTANSLDVSVTAAGSIFLLETDAVTLTDVDTADGSITITANGTITATDVQSLTDATNVITLTTTTGNVLVDLVNAVGDTIIVNAAAAIEESGSDASADMSASVITLTAVSGIGALGTIEINTITTVSRGLTATVTAAGPINLLDTTGGMRVLSATTANGPITLAATTGDIIIETITSTTDADANDVTVTASSGNILVGTINAGTTNGDVFLTASAAISDVDAINPDITADDIVLLAGTGIGAGDPLETAASNLEANGGTGGVFVANTGALTIGLIGATTGISATGGDIVVSTTGAMTIAENVTATGAGTDVTLTAIDAASAGQNIVLNNTVTVSSAAASVTLNAGDNATITGNITSGTTTNINVDFGDAESAAVTEAVSGGLLNITGVITTPVVSSGGGAFLAGNDDFDTFTFNPQTTTEFRVLGDLPVSTVTGDTLVMDVTGTTNPNLTTPGSLAPYTGPGSGAWSFTSAHRPVLFGSIEQSTITGNYHLTYDNGVSPVGNLVVMRDAGQTNLQIRDGSVAGPVLFQGSLGVILSLRILGSTGNDMVTVDDINTLPNFSGTVPGVTNNGNIAGTAEFLFDGLGGSDTLVYNINGATASQTYAIGNGSGSAGLEGEIESIAAGINLLSYFQNVELTQRTGSGASAGALSILGDSGDNAFAMQANGTATRTTITGYTPFEFSGNNYSSLSISSLAGSDSIDLIGYGTVQTANRPITLNGGTEADTIRVRSTSGNTGLVTLNGNAGDDLFQLYDATGTGTVDNIAGQVIVDGTDGNVGGNVDTLTIVDSADGSGDTVLISAVNPASSADYSVEGINTVSGSDVIFRNVDVLNYTGTSVADNIDTRLVDTIPLSDLNTVSVSGWTGADQFYLFISDQLGGSGPGVTPTGAASGVASVSLYGDAPGNPNPGDGNDIFGAKPVGIIGTGVTNVGLVVPDTTRMIRPSATTSIAIDGGRPTGPFPPMGDIVGDVLNTDISALPNTNPVVVSTFSPGTVVASGIQPFTWTEIEDINLVDQGKLTNVQMGDLFARTTPGNDLVQLQRNPTALNPFQTRLRINATIANYSASNKTLIYGGDGNDNITQSNLTIPAEFYGELGDDVLSGALNNDWLVGGLGNDRINGSGGDNVIWGDNSPTLPTDPNPQDLAIGGNDILSGLGGADVFYAGGGDDSVSAGAGNDYANGGFGNDVLDGHDGDDRMYGADGNDTLTGFNGNDLLSAGAGNDFLFGNSGNDVLFGGTGEDMLDGGDGNDLLVSGSVANESSSRTALATTSTYSPATYTNGADNDSALLVLLAQWGSSSNRSSIAAILHDGADDDIYGSTGDDDFCWEMPDIADDFPAIAPPDYQGPGMGNDERFGPIA